MLSFAQAAEFDAFKQEAAAKSKRARELVEERDREVVMLTEKLAALERKANGSGGDGFGLTEKSLLKYAQEQSRREAEVSTFRQTLWHVVSLSYAYCLRLLASVCDCTSVCIHLTVRFCASLSSWSVYQGVPVPSWRG